jgi:hypothetical protein
MLPLRAFPLLTLATPVWLLAPGAVRIALAQAPPPLHERIDQAIAAGARDFPRRAAGPASDDEFLRRIFLDLTGSIPTATEARTFLQDRAPDKRRVLIDRLLASPEHARHLATVFDVLLMERLPDKHVPRGEWHEYLRASVAANKPWDVLVREILGSDGSDPKQRAPAKFLLDRGAEPNLLTRDVSRLFLGMNLQCAQCHDHPRVEEYKQDHYYGLYAFVSRTSVVIERTARRAVLAEKADGEVTFQSVFDPAKVIKRTGPRVPGGPALKEPALVKGKEYRVAPAPGVRSVPEFSRRAQLGPQVARPDNGPFTRNAANRLWALLMGRGPVHPLDMDHPANPPSHPELLDLLAREFAARKFDVRGFLRELALSQTYQRSSVPPSGVEPLPVDRFAVAIMKPLSPEQLAWSLMQGAGLTDAERQALGARATEAALYGRLAGNVAPFVNAFGSPPGTPQRFDARLDQALFLANGPVVRGWLAARPGSLTDRLARLGTADAVAEELYLSVLTRFPTAEERKEVADFLAGRGGDRPAALQDLAWALLTSAEFRFNH